MTRWSSTPKQLLNNCEQWVCESKQHCNTNADQERSVDQTSQKEHLSLEWLHQFWLTCTSFDVFTTHQCDTQTCTDRAEADDDADTDSC